MKVYVLFETDAWQSRASRVCLGVFASIHKLLEAVHNNHVSHFIMVECELDEFTEL